MLKKIILILYIIFSLSLHAEPDFVSIHIRNVYSNGTKLSPMDSKRILSVLRGLRDAVLEKDADKILRYISKEKGAYLDVKGLWEYDRILEEAKKEDSYFEVYFFDRQKLVKQKESEDVFTVRELLLKSDGIEIDLFFDSENACEVKLIFKNNTKLEKDMNNPYLVKVNGRWFIYRLF